LDLGDLKMLVLLLLGVLLGTFAFRVLNPVDGVDFFTSLVVVVVCGFELFRQLGVFS